MKKGIKGEISAFPLTDILQWIDASRKTGVLIVTSGDDSDCLCFEEGKLLLASSRSEGRRFGDFLNSEMQVPLEVTKGLLDRARAESIPFIGLLIDQKIVPEEFMKTALQQTAERVILGILCQQGGAFEFIEEVPSYMKRSPVKLPANFIIFEAVRKYDEMRNRNETL